jgi:hypothetical protein
MEGTVRSSLLIVVEDDEPVGDALEEATEVVARERLAATCMLGAEPRQTRLGAVAGKARRDAQMMKKGADVRVCGVDAVPETGDAPGSQIARDEGRLARTGRRLEPDDRALSRRIETGQQPGSLDGTLEGRWRDLGWRYVVHSTAVSACSGAVFSVSRSPMTSSARTKC